MAKDKKNSTSEKQPPENKKMTSKKNKSPKKTPAVLRSGLFSYKPDEEKKGNPVNFTVSDKKKK